MITLGKIKTEEGTVLLDVYENDAEQRTRSFRIHHHIEFELCYVLSGDGIYSAKNIYKIEAGNLFCFRSNEPHCITDISTDKMHVLNIHIAPQYLYFLHPVSSYQHAIGNGFLSGQFSSQKLDDFFDFEDLQEIKRKILRIKSEFSEQKREYLFEIENLINSIIVILSRYQVREENSELITKKKYDAIMQTVSYIDEHFQEQIRLSELAKIAYLTESYYSSLFKMVVGMNVSEYIAIKRVDFSRNLLKTTEDSILQIALKSGFNNTANFNKIFKKYTGKTPKELR